MNMKTSYNTYFFFLILFGLTVLGFFIIKPFLIPFILALILAHFLNPVYNFILKKTKSQGWSSILVCFLTAMVIIAPVMIIIAIVVNEIQAAIANITPNSDPILRIMDLYNQALAAVPFVRADEILNVTSFSSIARSFSQWMLSALQGAYTGVFNFVFAMFIMFFSLFYMLIDGSKLAKKAMKIFPLKDEYDTLLLNDLNSIIRATIKGTIVIAVIQGFAGGILFALTGVSSPVFLGILTMIASVIPSLGSALVWLPAGIIMILVGNTVPGIIILLAGALVISSIDNLLRPRLVGHDTQIHPLLILFSTLGGITLFGISGFIIGPIAISVIVALWDIYILEFKA